MASVTRNLDRIRKALELRCPHRRDQSMLGEVPAQGVDHLGASADKHLPRAKQNRTGLLCLRLHREEAHGRAQRRLDNRLGIRRIVLLGLYE